MSTDEKEIDYAHRRIDEMGERMHEGFTSIRREMASDKKDILNAISKNKPENANGYVVKSVSTVFAILLPFLGLCGTMMWNMHSSVVERLDRHFDLEGHPDMIARTSDLKAKREGDAERINSLDERVENFKLERARINNNESNIKALKEQVNIAVEHTKVNGHPHVQTERISQIEKRLDEKTDDRIKKSEVDIRENVIYKMIEDNSRDIKNMEGKINAQ